MKKSGKVRINLMVVLLLAVFLTVMFKGTEAKADFFGGDRKNGPAPRAFYTSSVSMLGYTANYDAGRAYWNSNSLVNIQKVGNINRPDLYYIGDTSVPGLGQVTPYNSAGLVAPLNGYWDYTTVFMYHNQMVAQSNYTNSRINYNAAHEIGHTLKMAHVGPPTNSVMVQGWRNIPSTITSYDSGEINRKWN